MATPRKSLFNIPTMLTLARIALIPLFVGIFYLHSWWGNMMAAAIFLIAGITDYLDGYLARRLNQSTRFGAFLDPVADKLMVAAALVLLVEYHANPWLAIPAIVIISREIAVSALREWMAEIGARGAVAVSWIGKVKTVMQITAITLLLAFEPQFEAGRKMVFTPFFVFNYVLLYIATALTLWSMLLYLRAAWPHLRDD
ncbi:MAG: CDP-diacylglycerol--glycerol-3-phosphate 3-phosphatidyltransferase [Gammaproteobacteria bacterium]